MNMTPERWAYTGHYLHDVFGEEPASFARLTEEAARASLPTISIGPEVGRLLQILASSTRGRVALELGTLGGYSAAWIAQGLSPGGRLVTLEADPRHAAFARGQLQELGLAASVEVRCGKALDVIPELARELGPESLDFVFIDAVKMEYPKYFELLHPMMAPGGLLVADNVLGAGDWWIDDEAHPSRREVDRFNRKVASSRDYQSACLPLREGLLVARRTGA